jgi:CheY-like chemotaxis protein
MTDGRKILIIEDHPGQRLIVKTVLAGEGYQVTAVSSAEEAAEVLRNNAVDLIVCDLNMPGKSGHEFIAEVKSNEHFSMLPIIVLTAASQAERVQHLASGADAVCDKISMRTELVAQIKKLLR